MLEIYPAIIWALIFKFLPHADLLMFKLVCREWYTIINCKSVQKNTVIRFQNQRLFDIGFPRMLCSAKNFLTCLVLKNVNLDAEIIRNDSSKELFSALKSLTVSHCSASDSKYLESIIKQCSGLKALHLNYLHDVQNMEKFLALQEDHAEVKKSLRLVTELDLNNHIVFSAVTFNRLVECMPNVSSLNVNYFYRIWYELGNYEDFMTLYDSLMAYLRKQAEKMKHLKIAHIFTKGSENANDVIISPDILMDLATMPKLKLKSATITMINGGNESLIPFLNKHDIHKLDIVGFRATENAAQYFKAMKNVRQLTLYRSKFPIENTISHLDNLKALTMYHSNMDTDWNFVREIKISKFQKSLETLSLDSSRTRVETNEIFDMITGIKRLTMLKFFGMDESASYMNKVLLNLKRLNFLCLQNTLPNCDFLINKESFTGSFKDVFQTFMEEKKIFEKNENRERDLEQISTFCSKHCHQEYLNILCPIESLILKSTKVNDIFFMAINFKHLRHVKLDYPALTDYGLMVLGAKNQDLETVVLKSCNITNKGLFGMLNGTTRLTDLRIYCCKKIVRDEVHEKLPQICKHLKYFLIHEKRFPLRKDMKNDLNNDHPLSMATERAIVQQKLKFYNSKIPFETI